MTKFYLLFPLFCFILSGSILAQDGQLDSSFANNGILKMDFVQGNETVNDVIEQPDGKLLTIFAGRYPNPETFDIVVMRFMPDGSVDSSFAVNGLFRNQNDKGSDLGYDLHLFDDGSILACGSFSNDDPNDTDFNVFKLTPEGELDSMFGTDGSTVVKIDSSQDYARSIAVADNGDIYLGGDSKVLGFGFDRSVILKLTATGKVDSTFGNNGVFMWNTDVPDGVSTSNVRRLLIAPDGNLLTSGRTKPNSNDRISLYKVLPDGSGLDTNFADRGELLLPLQGSGYGLAIHPDSTILVTGNNLTTDGFDLVVAAFDQNGVEKDDFGVFGVVTINPGPNDVGLDIAVQPDGKIVVGGETGGNIRTGPPRKFLAARLDITGKMDSTWGDAGIVTTMTSDFFAFPNAIMVQRDGKIVLGGGSATTTSGNDLTLVRYNNFIDADGDGYSIVDDCNDFVFEINPGAFDIADNGIDEDCSGDDSPVAVRETDLSAGFVVFPNPANNEITLRSMDLSLAPHRIDVYHVSGQLLRSYLPSLRAEVQTLSLAGLPAGMLVLRLETKNGTAVKRIVKR
ncbi:T9SS type A sorting domain-containing protein [Neolewinella persica]|uniref:T9SS type A sorting domain-containing protein n=1 Tax=Neolewinella persica TaxID=70998 RepID=UPI00037DA72C|nr:T9SS type A sorting domain-containing protein [Neolewinella persica]